MFAAILSAVHLLSLGVGLGAVFSRGLALRAVAAGDRQATARVLFADNFWGAASLIWIASGLMRLFGGLEKTLDFYLHNGFFWVKMGLFALIFVLEVTPMVAFIQWRIQVRNGGMPDTSRAVLFTWLNDAETVLVILIPFAAAAMVRGLWLLE